MKYLTTPITDDDLSNLHIGDQITISGTIYTGRDAALPQLVELIKKNKVMLFFRKNVTHNDINNALHE